MVIEYVLLSFVQNYNHFDGLIQILMEKWKNGKMEEWKNGRMEKWKNGRVEEWKDEKMVE